MKIMAIDLGDVRTGLAICDRTEFLAYPIGTVVEKDFSQLLNKIVIIIKEYEVKMVVVGHPVNMDGSLGERARKCEKFADDLKKLVDISVVLWDERQSTMLASKYLNAANTRWKKRKRVIDEVAATIILESYLKYKKNHPDSS